jgi:hypothetical protein
MPAPASAPAPTAPATGPIAPKSDPWALPDGPRDERRSVRAESLKTEGWAKAQNTKGVAPAKASCAEYARRAAARPAPTDLTSALGEKDAGKRDALLLALEDKPETKLTIRALRAELAPLECADALTDPLLSSSATVTGLSGHALVGLSLASKLSRTAEGAPTMKDASDKEKLKRFIQGPLRTWMVGQASAIDALSAAGVDLGGIARGLVAIEAGMADLRLVDRIRSAPIPSTWDKELVAVYEAALDEALEPRKTRGRDASLVGLADFAGAEIVHDARISRARALLSKLYGGRRIDALDGLLVPGDEGSPPPPAWPETVPLLLSLGDPAAARQLAGLHPPPPPPSHRDARARLEMGKSYWRRSDFVEAAHAAAKDKEGDANARLVVALALTLAKGPNGAKEMMSAPSPAALGLDHTEALDALAAESKKTSGLAAFDAAYLRALSPPEGEAARPYLLDVAARFRKAATMLDDGALKKRAEDRANEAESLAKAVATK